MPTEALWGPQVRHGGLEATATSSTVIFLAWCIPVALSLLSTGHSAIVAATGVAAAVSAGAILASPSTLLVALPFFALLSPVAGFVDAGGTRLVLSDVVFVLLAPQMAVLLLVRRVRLYETFHTIALSFLAGLYCVSTLTGVLTGTLVSMKPILYLAEFVLIYLYTAEYARHPRAWSRVLDAWIGATILGALLLIRAYLSGVMLNQFDLGAYPQAVDRQSLTYLFQATYYYTGFHYALGIATAIAIIKLFLSPSRRTKLVLLGALPVMIAALVMMLNKTALLAVMLALVVTFAVLATRLSGTRMTKILLVFGTLAAVALVMVLTVYVRFLGNGQGEIWARQATGTSSLVARTAVYVHALSLWPTYPLHVVVGMGPDFLDNSGAPDLAHAFKWSSLIGAAEGTVDSGWISYLLELGIVAWLVLAALFITALTRVLRYVRAGALKMEGGEASAYILAGLVFTCIALMTQMLGYAKIAWLPFQLLVIGLLHRRGAFVPARSAALSVS